MVFRKGRFDAMLLAGLLALAPSAALAQCQHMSNRGQTNVPSMGQFGGGMMSSMGFLRMQGPPTFPMQSQQMQWTALMQNQQSLLQQMQLIALQQQMQQQMLVQAQMQRIALQQSQLNQVQQPPSTPPDVQTSSTHLPLAQRKKYGPLLQQMEELERRMTGLEGAAQRNDLQPPQASALQNDVLALQSQVDAAAGIPTAIQDRMSSLHRRADDLLDRISAKPADLIASLRNPR